MSLIKEKVCHYLSGDMGRGIMKKVTNGEIGGGGLKFGIFTVTSFFNGPLIIFITIIIIFIIINNIIFFIIVVIVVKAFPAKLYKITTLSKRSSKK